MDFRPRAVLLFFGLLRPKKLLLSYLADLLAPISLIAGSNSFSYLFNPEIIYLILTRDFTLKIMGEGHYVSTLQFPCFLVPSDGLESLTESRSPAKMEYDRHIF